jgi:5-methyltetrahydrofolate--homocysteine methyltransferase
MTIQCTVKGDLHDLEMAGFEVINLGVDAPVEKFIQAAQEEKPDIVAISALVTITIQMMKQTIDAFSAAGLRNKVKIIHCWWSARDKRVCQRDRCRWLLAGC